MKLCITEKPSVAKDIAQIIGANVKRDGYYEGGDYKVTSVYTKGATRLQRILETLEPGGSAYDSAQIRY